MIFRGSHPLSILSRRLRVLDLHFYYNSQINEKEEEEAGRLFHLLGSFKYLRFLRLRSAQMKELPENVSTLYYLQTLILDYCGWNSDVASLPDSIGSLKNLRHLSLQAVPLMALPSSIGELKELRYLNLNKTKIRLLPHSIGNLKELKHLDVEGTSLELLPDSIGNMKHLRYLNLSGTSVKMLPDSIGCLKDLRPLDLAFTSLERIPESICSLYNLHYLSVKFCSQLVELPSKMMHLVNLCHLHIKNTRLKSMPPHMGNLVKLQTLSRFVVGKEEGLGIVELGELRHLQGDLFLENLQNVADAQEGLEANLKDKSSLERLVYAWDDDNDDNSSVDRSLLQHLQPHLNIKVISIYAYRGTCFPSWVGDSCFSNIEELYLINCKYCTCLPPLGQLVSLKFLNIQGFDSIVSVGAEFYGDYRSIPPFRSLLKMVFARMPQWEEWTCCHENEAEDDDFALFPPAWHMIISECPVLQTLRGGTLASTLLQLKINACPLLEQRCQKEQGDYWHKISHIPEIFIGP